MSYIDKLKMEIAKDYLAISNAQEQKRNYKECQKKMRNKGKAEQRQQEAADYRFGKTQM